MFLDFYPLREQPFADSPDPRFLYLSPVHSEALAALHCGIEMDQGLLVLISEPGLGKSTLVFELAERLRHSARVLFLLPDAGDSVGLLHSLILKLGSAADGLSGRLMEQLNVVLAREAQAGKPIILVVDEAQNLDEPALETLRLISNLGLPHARLLQIILVGQPLLAEKLARPSLSQLRQRISNSSHLGPLDHAETGRYIEHRLMIAGHSGEPLFAREAIVAIAAASGGVPRVINHLATSALLLGYAQNQRKIGREAVQEAASDLNLTPPPDAKAHSPELSAMPMFKLDFSSQLGERLRGITFGRVAMVAVLALAVLLSSFRFESSARTSRRTDSPSSPAAISAAVAPSLSAPDSQPSAAPPAQLPSQPERIQASAQTESLRPVIVFVASKQTLRQICLRYLGRFDAQVVAEIQSLNPWMQDPNRLEIGQQIRLPASLNSQAQRTSAAQISSGVKADQKP